MLYTLVLSRSTAAAPVKGRTNKKFKGKNDEANCMHEVENILLTHLILPMRPWEDF